MVNISLVAAPLVYQGIEVTTDTNCSFERKMDQDMPTRQFAGFDAEIGRIEGLIKGLSSFRCSGKMTIVVENEACHMHGAYETFFPDAMDGLYHALGTIGAFCRSLREQAPRGTFKVRFEIEQTSKIIGPT